MNASTEGVATRAIVAEVVHAVVHTGRNLEHALDAAGANALQGRDRAFVRALCFGTLRTHLRNRFIIRQLVQRPFKRKDRVIEALVSVALHELLDAAAPDYAVVSATVAATRTLGRHSMRGLVNALLRRFQRERAALLMAATADPEARWQHPAWLIDALQADWPDDWEAILKAGNQQAPMWLRVNLAQTSRSVWLQQLQDSGLHADAAYPAEQLPAAVLLAAPAGVEQLPGFADGACSVQDAASQLAAPLLGVASGMRVLDACAAPGGKTGHLLELAEGSLQLTAVDNSAARLPRVHENLARLKVTAKVVCGDALKPADWWDGEGFDRILLDAPCSAIGVLRRHPDIRYLRRADDINTLQALQAKMLRALWALLKPGGRLLYSTCSVLRAENEHIVTSFLASEKSAREISLTDTLPAGWALATPHGMYLLPGRRATDGFYYALIERQNA